jgi:hypothetical protein
MGDRNISLFRSWNKKLGPRYKHRAATRLYCFLKTDHFFGVLAGVALGFDPGGGGFGVSLFGVDSDLT